MLRFFGGVYGVFEVSEWWSWGTRASLFGGTCCELRMGNLSWDIRLRMLYNYFRIKEMKMGEQVE